MKNLSKQNDSLWHIGVARIEVMIEQYGICNVIGAVSEALENIGVELTEENPDFENTQHHKNLEHQKRVIEYAMDAVDLNSIYGNAEARRIALERFKDNIEEALENHG